MSSITPFVPIESYFKWCSKKKRYGWRSNTQCIWWSYSKEKLIILSIYCENFQLKQLIWGMIKRALDTSVKFTYFRHTLLFERVSFVLYIFILLLWCPTRWWYLGCSLCIPLGSSITIRSLSSKIGIALSCHRLFLLSWSTDHGGYE